MDCVETGREAVGDPGGTEVSLKGGTARTVGADGAATDWTFLEWSTFSSETGWSPCNAAAMRPHRT